MFFVIQGAPEQHEASVLEVRARVLRGATMKYGKQMSQNGELAQLGERLLCTQEVSGSNPLFSTRNG